MPFNLEEITRCGFCFKSMTLQEKLKHQNTCRYRPHPDQAGNRCTACVFFDFCDKDAKDPDCYPYGRGCDEFTTFMQDLECNDQNFIVLQDILYPELN